MLIDQFAMAALTGFTAGLKPGDFFNLDIQARQAYEMALAMMRARPKAMLAYEAEFNATRTPATTNTEETPQPPVYSSAEEFQQFIKGKS